MTERPAGKRETNKQDRRQAIIDAARRSFLGEGYAATSMSGLLKILGGSKATLWSYFRSKEELFAAVIENLASGISDELESGLLGTADLEGTLATFLARLMEKTALPDTVAAWRLIVGESGRFPELGRIFYEQAARRVETSLAAYLRDQVAAGRLRDENPNRMAQILMGFCSDRQNKMLWGVASADGDDLDADAALFTRYFLRLFGTGTTIEPSV
ncbi:TetR/AcrR family transcriptional regulator [Sphingomonas sp. PB2P12]|uniref:TetR/AcrR family transcriptional regulator n=1 Tax=Sphingomonas sandaracina TaxID=3096157 RepID=UPI002FC8BDD4